MGQDIMIRNLTVEENICFSAMTRLPTSWPMTRKLEMVEQ